MSNKKLIKNWIKTLKSGKYKKGTKFLRTDNQFCCLGVLCDIEAPDKWEGAYDHISHNKQTTIPSFKYTNEYGLSKDDIVLLCRLNDGNSTWTKVIKYLEKITGPKKKKNVKTNS